MITLLRFQLKLSSRPLEQHCDIFEVAGTAGCEVPVSNQVTLIVEEETLTFSFKMASRELRPSDRKAA